MDLQLKAEVEGFSQLLVVKTPAAAQHPDLASLKFKLDTVGLNVCNGEPVLVGNGDWDKFTVTAPGDLNGDNVPDLRLRDNATGDLLRAYGSKGGDGNVDPTTWGNAAGRVKIASGLEQAAFPTIGTSGDVTGDKLADLWAVSANRQLATLAGTGTRSP
ncbi:hypothetical protein [Streptomyces sp. R33]|uniref:VCBS repeat-containing protein n=1 Tax=Streptomyces sp. R33 TaxID=3238629 RepID=A0AB39YCA9_9ACTN